MKFIKSTFEFELRNEQQYSAHWYINDYEYNKKRKFEVAIWRGFVYKTSYYTDNRICEKNSRELIEKYLKSINESNNK